MRPGVSAALPARGPCWPIMRTRKIVLNLDEAVLQAASGRLWKDKRTLKEELAWLIEQGLRHADDDQAADDEPLAQAV